MSRSFFFFSLFQCVCSLEVFPFLRSPMLFTFPNVYLLSLLADLCPFELLVVHLRVIREALCLVPASPPNRFEGAKITFFLNGRFVTKFGSPALRVALPCSFTFFLAPARPHFGGLELMGNQIKDGFPWSKIWNPLRAIVF